MSRRARYGGKCNDRYTTGFYPPLKRDSFWKRVWAKAARRFGKKLPVDQYSEVNSTELDNEV